MAVFAPARTIQYYESGFAASENPISEGGAWHHLDSTLTGVQTEQIGGVHVAHGTQAGGPSAPYDDSNAYLAGFPRDHAVEGTIWKSGSIGDSENREAELLLRWSDDHAPVDTDFGPTSVQGYEINVQHLGNYLQLGRFKGDLLEQTTVSTPVSGDKFYAQIRQEGASVRIIVAWNGQVKINYVDSTPWLSGNPGMGFFIHAGANNNEFGFSRIVAWGF